MKRVCLFSLEQVAVVTQSCSGVVYFNRIESELGEEIVEQEGVLVPLSNDAPEGFPSLLERLRELFVGESRPALQELDGVLQEVSSSDQLTVDRDNWSQSRGGWVFLKIRPQGDFSQFEGFEAAQPAVLTWPLAR